MIEIVQWNIAATTDWEIGVFAQIQWARQRADVILIDDEGYRTSLSARISELKNTEQTKQVQEMLRILYEHEFIEQALKSIEPWILTADFDSKRTQVNPFGKILGVFHHPSSWRDQLPSKPTVLEKDWVKYYNPFTIWKTSGKALSNAYRAFVEFQARDAEIWSVLQSELRAGWKKPERKISQWKTENVAEHTKRWINMIHRYKQDIMEELGCNWLEIARMIAMFRIHDYPEAHKELGDIADSDNRVTPLEKTRRTQEAAWIIFGRFGEDGKRLLALWTEAEECTTRSGRMVKEIDKIQAVEQALYYETQGWICFVEFYAGVINRGFISFNTTKKIMLDLGLKYLGYLEWVWKTHEIQEFIPIIERVQNIQPWK